MMRKMLTAGAVLLAAAVGAADAPVEDITVNEPDYLVFRPRATADRTRRDRARAGDGVNEHFHVLWKSSSKTFFAFWTQSTTEGCPDQHIAFAKSTDGGRTWTEPVLFQGSQNLRNPGLMASWQLPMVSKSGRLYVVWNQMVSTITGQGQGAMFGCYSKDDGETWSWPERVDFPETKWCAWQRPMRLAPGGKYLTADTWDVRTRYLRFDNIDDDPEIRDLRVTVLADGEKRLVGEESSLVKLPDGRLFTVMRTNKGHPTWSQSRDGGETWDPAKPLKDATGKEIRHPRAPCPIYDYRGDGAASGEYFGLFTDVCDMSKDEYKQRGPLYLYRGAFDPDGEQPVRFTKGELLLKRPADFRKYGNSCYSSYTYVNGEGVLWFPDNKFTLLGKIMAPALRPHPVFRDGLVLAAGKPIRVFGVGDGKVRVTFRGRTGETVGRGGRWLVELPPAAKGGPYEMTLDLGGRVVTLKDVRVGEVYLMAGQSNMQFKLAQTSTSPSDWRDESRLRAYSLFRPEGGDAFAPAHGWVPCEKATAGRWSAIAYHFGLDRVVASGSAVGVVNCYQGASVVQSWLPAEIVAEPRFAMRPDDLHFDHTHPAYAVWNVPGMLYGSMFRKIVPFSFSGVVWYQGESNTKVGEARLYADFMAELIRTWRRDLGDGELPFYVIQIADFDRRPDEGWKAIQREQMRIPTLVPNVKVIPCADICESDGIHPVTKSALGRRLSEAVFPPASGSEDNFVQ